MSSRQPPVGATFAYETAIAALDEQLRRVDGLDSKAGILLAADGVILGLLLRSDAWAAPTWVVVVVGVLILASLTASILALLNRRYQVAPSGERARGPPHEPSLDPNEGAVPHRRAGVATCDVDRGGRILAVESLHRGRLMEATVAARSEADEVIRPVQIPPPVEGGTVIVEDLGRWVAWLTGGLRRERRIAREAAHLYGETPTSEPEPVEVPAPVPGGTEPITKGGDPPAETR